MKAPAVAGKEVECDRETVLCGRWHQIKCLSYLFTTCFSEDAKLLDDNKASLSRTNTQAVEDS